jgi:hypothetical protein
MQAIQVFTYNNQEIEFDPTSSALMVNATEMAKVFGKRLDHFLKTDHAQEFIRVLELTPFGGKPAMGAPRKTVVNLNSFV